MKYVKIYGERNTNTNYLRQLVRLNLEVAELPGVIPKRMQKIQARLPAKNLLRDIYFWCTFHRNLGWKHSQAPASSQLAKMRVVKKHEVVFLTITKNPYSWLLSLYKRPYHQYYREKPTFEEFLRIPWTTVYRERVRQEVANPIELWNLKNQSYLQLGSLQAVNLSAESILEDPEAIITDLAQNFSIPRSTDSFVNFEESTKYESRDSSYYRDFYLQERWRSDLSSEAIAIINDQLSADLMQHFGYEFLG